MDNFDLKKYLSKNPLLTEGQFSWMTQDTGKQIGSEPQNTITVYMHDNKGNVWREDNYEGYGEFGGKDYYELLDQMNGGSGDRQAGIKLAFDEEKKGEVLFPALTQDSLPPYGHDFTEEADHDPDQSWYAPEEDEDEWEDDPFAPDYGDDDEDEDYLQENEDGEKAFDAELMATANGIAATLGKELKAKKDNKEQLDEAIITTVIAGVLTANTLINFISKMSAKLMKKLNWKKGEDFAEKIHHWAHDNEVAFQAPIKRVLAFFIKNPKTLDITTKAIYALVVASMAAGYGAEAVNGLSKADWFKGALSSLKAVAKSDEAFANAYPAIKALMA